MERAIRQTIQSDRRADRAPALVDQPAQRAPQPLNLDTLERMVTLAKQMHDMTGKTPRTIAGPINRLIKVGLKAMDSPTEGAP